MNKTQSSMLKSELVAVMSSFLVWVDEHMDHPTTADGVEAEMAIAALAVLNASWEAFRQGGTEND